MATEEGDILIGGKGNDILIAGFKPLESYFSIQKRSVLIGGEGNDILMGDKDSDILIGAAGNDRMSGGGGSDSLLGGSGKDVFYYDKIEDSTFSSPDRIIDFETGCDKIDISSVNKNNKNFYSPKIKQVNHFSYQENEMIVHYNEVKNLTSLMLDYNGNGKADLLIEIIGEINPIADIVT